jgi:hypothetical protein
MVKVGLRASIWISALWEKEQASEHAAGHVFGIQLGRLVCSTGDYVMPCRVCHYAPF